MSPGRHSHIPKNEDPEPGYRFMQGGSARGR
jgi:hypothetical protein